MNQQFTHVEGEGFRFYDFIFPLFQFLIGVAIPLSLWKRLAQGDTKGKTLRDFFIRLFWMIVIGFFIHGIQPDQAPLAGCAGVGLTGKHDAHHKPSTPFFPARPGGAMS